MGSASRGSPKITVGGFGGERPVGVMLSGCINEVLKESFGLIKGSSLPRRRRLVTSES